MFIFRQVVNGAIHRRDVYTCCEECGILECRCVWEDDSLVPCMDRLYYSKRLVGRGAMPSVNFLWLHPLSANPFIF